MHNRIARQMTTIHARMTEERVNAGISQILGLSTATLRREPRLPKWLIKRLFATVEVLTPSPRDLRLGRNAYLDRLVFTIEQAPAGVRLRPLVIAGLTIPTKYQIRLLRLCFEPEKENAL